MVTGGVTAMLISSSRIKLWSTGHTFGSVEDHHAYDLMPWRRDSEGVLLGAVERYVELDFVWKFSGPPPPSTLRLLMAIQIATSSSSDSTADPPDQTKSGGRVKRV
jgi:hypothetical protein